MHDAHRNLQTYIRIHIGLFTYEIYGNWVREEEFEMLV